MELSLPVAERDNIRIRRAQVPESVSVVGMTPNPVDDEGKQIKDYLRRKECSVGNNREFRKMLEYSPETIKAVNNLPS
jgi:hypothetical protein